jgi:hypothetical protein
VKIPEFISRINPHNSHRNEKFIRYLASCTLQFWSNLTKISFKVSILIIFVYCCKYDMCNFTFSRRQTLSKFLIYYFCYLYISFHACESTSNDTKGFSWKGLPSWKCEITHVIFTTIHTNNYFGTQPTWRHWRHMKTSSLKRKVYTLFGFVYASILI